MIVNPVERGGTEDLLEGLDERERGAIGHHEPDAWRMRLQPVTCRRQHRPRAIEPDDVAVRQAFGQQGRQATRTATEVQRPLGALQLDAIEHATSPRLLRRRDLAVPIGIPVRRHGSPLPSVHTESHVLSPSP